MYRAYLNNNLFFSSGSGMENLKLGYADLDLTAGSAGTFTFAAEPDNVAYGQFEKLTSYIDVYRDQELIFSGRVTDQSLSMKLKETIKCEGLLAVLNDSVFRPMSFNGSLLGLIEEIILSHNEQVGEDKQLIIGTIEITDEYLDREYQNYETSMSRLLDLVESYGGYMSVTKSGDALYFNWTEEIAGVNTQGIDFGRNLLDIRQQSTATDIITVLIPLGAEIQQEDGTSKRLTIESVNDGKDYLINQAGIDEFGLVVGVQIWDDVTTESILRTRGQAYLNLQAMSRVTIDVEAVDLAGVEMIEILSTATAGQAIAGVTTVGTVVQNVPAEIENFKIGQLIPVKSAAHGINSDFRCLTQHLSLTDPTKNRMTLGKTEPGYIGINENRTNSNTRRIEHITADYVKNQQINDIRVNLSEYYTLITQNSEAISSQATKITSLEGKVTENSTQILQTANAVSVFVDENGRVLSYFRLDSAGLWIGKANDPINLLETNRTIQFIDQSGNIVLLEINTGGIEAPQISVTQQIEFNEGGYAEWAIRKGNPVAGKHNLNDIWIGG